MSGLEEMPREELIALTRALLVENAALRERVAILEKQNAELRERAARLERLISRNSGNSGMPPSVDDLPGRTAPKKRAAKSGQAGKRGPGKQPGAEGTALAWSDRVAAGDITEYFPQGSCACGADLGEAADLGVTARHQQIEIPLVSARRFQLNLHTVACRCGRVHCAERPAGVPAAPVSFGINLQAWCVYLMVVHAIPVHRCVELVTSLTGAEPSPGFVHGLISRAAGAVAKANARIRTLLTLAHVVCCDETPIRVGPAKAKRYLLVAATKSLTWYRRGGARPKTPESDWNAVDVERCDLLPPPRPTGRRPSAGRRRANPRARIPTGHRSGPFQPSRARGPALSPLRCLEDGRRRTWRYSKLYLSTEVAGRPGTLQMKLDILKARGLLRHLPPIGAFRTW
ncbi:transposase [Nonomuraea sp. B12E4]|uniref:DUF6444 domain-containing protein n=1 Tax=Nonomuraea sp. B12E4 TaxID=3153564 RepID=UPI00325D7CF4